MPVSNAGACVSIVVIWHAVWLVYIVQSISTYYSVCWMAATANSDSSLRCSLRKCLVVAGMNTYVRWCETSMWHVTRWGTTSTTRTTTTMEIFSRNEQQQQQQKKKRKPELKFIFPVHVRCSWYHLFRYQVAILFHVRLRVPAKPVRPPQFWQYAQQHTQQPNHRMTNIQCA